MGCMQGLLGVEFLWSWITDAFGDNGLTNNSTGVLIVNKSSSQMISATIWTITMDVYSWNVTEVNAFSQSLIQHHNGRTPSVYCLENYWIWYVMPSTPNWRDPKHSVFLQGTFKTWGLHAFSAHFWNCTSAKQCPTHIVLNVQAFFHVQHNLLLPWPACFRICGLLQISRITPIAGLFVPLVGHSPTACRVLIGNKSSFQESPAAIWTIDVYSSDAIEVNAFSRSILSSVILDECQELWYGRILDIICDTNYSKFQVL